MTFWSARSGRAFSGAMALATFLPSIADAQQKNGLLVGRVLSGDVAVPGAAIYVTGGRVTLARVDGRYRISLPAGHYEVRAQRIGYTSARDTITVVAGVTDTSNFRLDPAVSPLAAVATLGTRGYERSVITLPAPVDLVSGPALRAAGQMQTSRALQSLAPSVNASRATVAEGSDLVHPVTMRGLGPDQVLVLVNGRRRHTSALMNVNHSTGRGSTGVDLDAIPASMIERVEVLRGGAAAQYGGEAVAGVINVILKSGVHGDAVSTVGGNVSTYNRGGSCCATSQPSDIHAAEQSVRDGRSVQASIDKGVVFGERGFLHGDVEYREREATNRTLPVAGATADQFTSRAGDPAARDLALFLNGGNLFTNGMEVYGNTGGSRRGMDAAAAYRVSDTGAGYVPTIRPTIDDYSATGGMKGTMGDWRFDLATSWGRNTVDYDVVNTSLSGTGGIGGAYDAGRIRSGQLTGNLDLYRNIALFDEVRLAAGAEVRRDSYGIDRTTGPLDIEGFAGFGGLQAIDRSRSNAAGYVDVEADLTPGLLIGAASRLDRFSDVGTTVAGHLSFRYEPRAGIALRGAAGRGERAPSLAQSSYSTFLTDPGITMMQSRIVRVDDPAAVAAGATALRPEQATDYSAGFALEPMPALSFSADLYQVEVRDRIVLLPSLVNATTSPEEYFASNAADTRTRGIDVNLHYGMTVNGAGKLRLTGGANLNRTSVLSARPGLSAEERTRIERGQPASSILGSAVFRQGAFGALLRAQRFGEVQSAGVEGGAATDERFPARWLTDANVSYTMLRKYTFTLGADNLLDAYPGRKNSTPLTDTMGAPVNGYVGNLPYNGVSPFGFNGRYVYGRLSIYL